MRNKRFQHIRPDAPALGINRKPSAHPSEKVALHSQLARERPFAPESSQFARAEQKLIHLRKLGCQQQRRCRSNQQEELNIGFSPKHNKPSRAQGLRGLFPAVFALVFMIFTGCGHVDATKQRLVSKPNMLFSDSTVFAYQSPFVAIIEPGSASDGGSAASGCSSCR